MRSDGGSPIVQASPDSPSAQEFTRIAEALAERIAVDSFVRGGGKRAPQEQGPRRLKIMR